MATVSEELFEERRDPLQQLKDIMFDLVWKEATKAQWFGMA